ncbi:MAG: polysaccharide biosynthesis/export family protein [Bacteroidales bacterium]|nr:polysaccharide biosynthesis/export family protein [Bacteroidales bacterium]
MKNNRSNNWIGLAVVALLLSFASCVPQKKMLYLKDVQMATESQSVNYVNERTVDYKLQPGDNLFIRIINTIDEKSVASLTGDNNLRANMSTDASIYLQSYTLDEQGCIELPLTGKIELKGLTVDGAKDKMQEMLNKYFNQTTLIVKLSNFNLTVLGEVVKPGMYKVYQSQINLFEAVAMAGNMTNFAKNDAVKIIRQTDNGSEVVTVDMGSADILTSPYYYLKPNDIIYVEPLKIKQWGFTTFPYSTAISIVTLGVTLYSIFRKTNPR